MPAGTPEPAPPAGAARVALIGLGLIGGSIARALRALPPAERPSLAAWSPSGPGRGAAAAALADGVVDAAPADVGAAIAGADLVVLAMPASAVVAWLQRLAAPGDLAGSLPSGATVTDVASTKATIVGCADQLRLRFVGGHPMAGREASGYPAGRADLFAGRPWVVVPGAAAGGVDEARVDWLVRACGAVPLPMDAAEHDAAAAAISHLPLVVAAALVEAVVGTGRDPDRPDWPAARALAATGWASATRLAHGDAAMGAAIVATNAANVARRLRDLQDVIDDWLAALERAGGPDEAALRERLELARDRLAEGEPRA